VLISLFLSQFVDREAIDSRKSLISEADAFVSRRFSRTLGRTVRTTRDSSVTGYLRSVTYKLFLYKTSLAVAHTCLTKTLISKSLKQVQGPRNIIIISLDKPFLFYDYDKRLDSVMVLSDPLFIFTLFFRLFNIRSTCKFARLNRQVFCLHKLIRSQNIGRA
jgi:hypothetical protein